MATNPSARRGSRPSITATEERLRAMEDQWMSDRLQGKADSTEEMLDDQYLGGTPSGHAQTKEEFVRGIASAPRTFDRCDQMERNIRIYGDTAVSTGVTVFSGPGLGRSYRYLRMFRWRGGAWRMIASLATPLSRT
jgi:hypothetical protein